MIMSSTKETITNILLKQLQHDDAYKNYDVQKIFIRWWMTGRKSEGLRLTDEGKFAFEKANISHYDFDLDSSIKKTPQYWIMQLNKKLKCPYYIGVKLVEKNKSPYIRIYDNKIAMLISLYGNLDGYIESLK